MGSESPDASSQRAIEGDLIDVGDKLLELLSSTDELLLLLEKAEGLLAQVWQQAPKSTCHSLLNIMKALITDEIFHHNELNVQVAVASCFNELTRITAPDPPYPDELMKVFFKLIMIAFEQLPCESGPNYSRALQIVETVAEVKSSLMLMDIDNGLIVEMFQLFLNNIRSTHPANAFKNMEKIMSLVIEESDDNDISVELLKPLLASVKMDNKTTSPMSWNLGKKVFENGAAKLQPYLREAVKAMNLDLDDYAEIVTSICHDTSNGKNMVSKKVSPTVGDAPSRLDELSRACNEDCAPQTDADNGNELDENSLDTLKGLQSGSDKVVIRRRRGRKPNSVMILEEGYERTWTRGGRYSGEISSDGYNEEKKDSPLSSELKNAKMLSDSSKKKIFSVTERSKKGQAKKKESMNNQHDNLEFSSKLKRKIMQNKVKKRGHNAQKKTGERGISGSSNISETGTEEKDELLPPDMEKIEKFTISKPAKGKHMMKEKEKKSKRSRVDYGEELVNLRIQVWWPMDETFYTGTVKAFDLVTKTHTILYDDDEIEVLNLRKERWELFDYERRPQIGLTKSSQKPEGNHPPPAKESLKTQQKNAKRKAGSLKKQHATSSSKRSKSENQNVNKSLHDSAPKFIHVNDESDDEMRETNNSSKDDGENHAREKESEKMMKKMETGPHIPEDVMKA